MAVLGFFTGLFIPNPFNVFINYALQILVAYLMLKNLVLKTVISVVLSIIIFNLISILILNPYLTVFNITSEQLNSIPIYRIIFIFVFLIFVFYSFIKTFLAYYTTLIFYCKL